MGLNGYKTSGAELVTLRNAGKNYGRGPKRIEAYAALT
jgi:hypothetical protein